MATPTAEAPLNAEPSRPEDRQSQHLEPKSYVEAVQEDPSQAINGAANGINESNWSTGVNGESQSDSDPSRSKHGIAILRITTTLGEGEPKGTPERSDEKQERPNLDREESKHEYSATVCILKTQDIYSGI
jgi:2-acylglycerol O-acyltransferase 2